MTDLIEVNKCEVCGNPNMDDGIDLGPLPLPDKLVPVGSNEECEKYPTDVLWCDVCKTAQQHFVIPQRKLFPPEYHYRGANTKDVLSGMNQLVDSVHRRFGSLEGKRVLDVGCNDGSLLDAFKLCGATTTGIEPTDAAHEASLKGHGIDNDYLNINSAYRYIKTYGVPDFITFVNVFAHIEDFPTLISALKTLCGTETNPDLIPVRPTKIIIENHYMGSVLDRNQFDTFYHEHIRTYSFTSFEFIAAALGMKIANVEFPSRYGGNIRVMLEPGQSDHRWDLQLSAHEADYGRRLQVLNEKVLTWEKFKRKQIASALESQYRIPAVAMPGRATILFNLLRLNEKWIDAVYEVPQSKKIGYYVPGTRIPIVADTSFQWSTCKGPVLNMAWHIPVEIETRLRSLGYQGEFIQAIDKLDFHV